jgi:membrane protein DedA with SNARE-associated domain
VRIATAAFLIIAATLIVPLAGATFGTPRYLPDAAAVLPMLALFAGLGVDFLAGFVLRRRRLKNDVEVGSVEGWDSDHLMPRS